MSKEIPTLDAAIETLRTMLGQSYGAQLWDLITALRGPDSPSEKNDNTSDPAYRARRERKARTVEVIRGKSRLAGGCARRRADRDWVELPPPAQWDHFDKHVARAAEVLGLEVRVMK